MNNLENYCKTPQMPKEKELSDFCPDIIYEPVTPLIFAKKNKLDKFALTNRRMAPLRS